jgi:hypothetical protein
MKSLKTAVVVGSVVVAGFAAPTAAADTPGGGSGAVAGVVKSLTEGPLKLLRQKPQAPRTPQQGSAPGAPNGARGPAAQQGGDALLGGLPVQRG